MKIQAKKARARTSLGQKLRLVLTLAIAKSASTTMRLLGRNATFLPGAIAHRLFPNFLTHLVYPDTVICVTGTNGKTTVTNLLIDAYRSRGEEPINNSFGSNTLDGIMTAFVQNVNWKGYSRPKTAVLEIDELSSRRIYPFVKPDYLLITNLYRDSYSRNAHPDFIVSVLEEHIPAETTLILNAEDLISGGLKQGNKRVYFAVDTNFDSGESKESLVCDLRNCPNCGHTLEKLHLRFHHIGYYRCPNCAFENPKAQYVLTAMDTEKNLLSIKETERGEIFQYRSFNKGIIDAYNGLSAIALLRENGWTVEDIQTLWEKQQVTRSRYEKKELAGRPMEMMLAKSLNPVSASRVFDYVRKQDGKKLVILLNTCMKKDDLNNENTAWLYEIDCELLNDTDIEKIVIGARRAYDYKLRLELAGIDAKRIQVFEGLDIPVEEISLEGIDRISIFHDFENLAETDDLIARLEAYHTPKKAGELL